MVRNLFKIAKHKWVPVLLAVLIPGCQTTITTGGAPTPTPTSVSTPSPTPTPGTKTETFEVFPNSMIQNGIISAGSNFVFKYYQSVDPIPLAVDDEYANTIIFEIAPAEKDSFTYENENLAKINAYTIHACFCPPDTTSPKPLLKGKITGTKLNSETWRVEGINDIANFSGEFKIKK